jgi:outer membrane protein assembly factor BamB
VPTPTVQGAYVFTLGDKGLVSCLRTKDGSIVWQEQLPKSNRAFSSSPILAGTHLYCLREDATTFVIDVSGEAGKVLAQNKLDGQAVATPAFIDNRIYLRTFEALYCIE